MSDERQGLLSASAAPRVLLCPGSLMFSKECPPEQPTDVTDDGVVIHKALQTEDDSALNDEQLDIANRIRALREVEVDNWAEYYGATDVMAAHLREERLWIRRRDNLTPLASAQLDFGVVKPPHALVIDYKTGFKPTVPAERNAQLMVQTLALWHEYPTLTNVRAGIVACRLKYHVDRVDYGVEDFQNAERKLHYALWEANQPDAPRHPGNWCTYCPCKAYCRECLAWASLEITVPPYNFPAITKDNAQAAVLALPLDSVAKIQDKATVIAAILNAVKERLKSTPEAQLNAVGYGLKPGRKTRAITDVLKAQDQLVPYLNTEEVTSCLSLSVADVEALIKTKLKLTKDQTKAKVAEIFGATMTVTEGERQLTKL